MNIMKNFSHKGTKGTKSKAYSFVNFVCFVRGIFILGFVLLVGCQSMNKDKLYQADGGKAEAALAEIESLVVPLDSLEGAELKKAASAARAKIAEAEKTALNDRAAEGRLAAWSGRLYLIEGSRKNAEAALKTADKLSPGSVEGRVLLIRMEKDADAREKLCNDAIAEAAGGSFAGSSGAFQIELGRDLLEKNYYREAAAAFDTAFPQLPAVYAETYLASREKAWTLRNLADGEGGKTAEIVLKTEITWEDAIEITNAETELLKFVTAGKSYPVSDLFKRLLEVQVIPPTQDIAAAADSSSTLKKTAQKDIILRCGASWYLWNLLAQARADKSLLTRYSSRYGAKSPVPDVGRDSIFFDSVLGCVEREIMSLPDGRNISGASAVSGTEFFTLVKKEK
jgi:hypothetical protein